MRRAFQVLGNPSHPSARIRSEKFPLHQAVTANQANRRVPTGALSFRAALVSPSKDL
jgi:ribosomal protein L4